MGYFTINCPPTLSWCIILRCRCSFHGGHVICIALWRLNGVRTRTPFCVYTGHYGPSPFCAHVTIVLRLMYIWRYDPCLDMVFICNREGRWWLYESSLEWRWSLRLECFCFRIKWLSAPFFFLSFLLSLRKGHRLTICPVMGFNSRLSVCTGTNPDFYT